MALVPGDGQPYHSRILWWVDEDVPNAVFHGGQWGWRGPIGPTDTTYSSTLLDPLGLPAPPQNVFCAAPIQLPDGRLMAVGGTEPFTENGIKQVNIFSPGPGTTSGCWNKTWCLDTLTTEAMGDRRWYPSATLLPDGRILATSGSKYPQIDVVGGRTNGATFPVDTTITRYGAVSGGVWDSAIVPNPGMVNANWPPALTGASGALMPGWGNLVYFGGRGKDGALTKDTWLIYRNEYATGPDYHYWATRASLMSFPNNKLPDLRAEHSAVSVLGARDTVILFGGLALEGPSEAASSQTWRFLHDPDSTTSLWKWEQIATNSGPSARFSHAAIYDSERKRMLVFGGIGAVGQNPSDQTVWQLQINPTAPATMVWRPVVVANGPKPSARFDHTLQFDDQHRTYTIAQNDIVQNVQSAVLFGGTGSGGTLSNEVWRLLFLPDSSVRWVQVPILSPQTAPSPRSGHAAVFESGTNRMFILGGTSPIGSLDDTMYVLDFNQTGTGGVSAAQWSAGARRGAALSGHVAAYYDPIFNRVPEVYSVSSNHWTPYPSSTLLQQWYPQTFVTPNSSKVFVSGPGDSTWTFDPSAGTWSPFPSNPRSGFTGGSAVTYLPGKVMKCCTRDTEVGLTAVTTTKTIDATQPPQTAAWTTSGSLTFGRVNMNLTLLPNGQVIVTGGTGFADNNHYINPRQIPEIWDPATGVWAGGSGAGQLAASSVRRGYHSTAILLPDARILCAGGNVAADLADVQTDRNFGDIYAPPYLFNSDGSLATRPTTGSAPVAHTSWGRVFTICSSRASTIKNICLIKPGATTHAFDQDQRYVPLSYVLASNPARLLVSAPADSTYAPPGDYLMFLVDSTTNSPRVPSVASWLKVDRLSGRDSSDTTAPGAVGDLAACPNPYYQAKVDLSWTAPWDDGTLVGSGQPVLYDIRYSLSPITDANWSSATQVSPVPPGPGTPGTGQVLTVNLSINHTYFFRMKTRDDNANYSALSNQATASTYWPPDCGGMFAGGGGGGGGASARPASVLAGTTQIGGQSSFSENSVLDGLSGSAEGSDVLRLAQPPVSASGNYQVRLRTEGTRRFALDRARLLVCDHDPSLSAYWAGGAVVLGTSVAARGAKSSDGTDVAALLSKGAGYSALSGTTIDVDPGSGSSDPITLILEAASGTIGGLADSSGVVVQSQDKSGAWQTVAQIHPRRGDAETAAPGVPSGPVRLQLLSDQTVSFIGSLAASATQPQTQSASLGSATTRSVPDQKPSLTSADSLTTAMAGPDTLMLSFAAVPAATGQARDYFLALDASLPATSAVQALRSQPVASDLPVAFALEQNRPNPFAGRTTIRFALPVGEMVRLDVFDAQGRRVRTLASHYFSAGTHSIEWDHTAEDGRSAGPGVYFYRIEAGPFRDRRKMVLITP